MNRTLWIVIAATALVAMTAGAGPLGCGRGGHGPHGMFQEDGEPDTDRLRRGAEWVLSSADPTDDQIDQAVEIVAAAMRDFKAMKEERGEQHERFAAALSSDAVDRADLEAMRAEMIARFETGSQRGLDAMIELAEVFTPEQRAKLIEEAEAHRGRHRGRWH